MEAHVTNASITIVQRREEKGRKGSVNTCAKKLYWCAEEGDE
jgi:hypothetical protein